MISPELLERLACPVCLEADGCPSCARPGAGHAACADEYAARVGCACGGPDKVRLTPNGAGLDCPCCGSRYPIDEAEGFVDLLPRDQVGDVTRYADHEFQERLQVVDGPPVLSARVKIDMACRMLGPAAGTAILDLGCGAGKLALHAGRAGVPVTGLDVAPFFLARARQSLDLVLGDLRRLPFRKASFENAYSLDVLEHLDEAGVTGVLREARRVVGPTGRLAVYTHAMESSRLARFQRLANRLARRLGQAGLIDYEREALRKSDHVNAIRSHEHFDELCRAAGLEVVERRYYNVVFKAVIEDLLLRLYEQRRRSRPVPRSRAVAEETAVTETPRAPDRHGALALAVARGLTFLLKLDVVLFGGIRTGPFFGLLRPIPREETA